jgi:DNA-damage-inducible protein D
MSENRVPNDPFESIKRFSKKGTEYWRARELQTLLGYDTWRRFEEAIERARVACQTIGVNIEDHFANSGKMIGLGKGATRQIVDYYLSRHACYLIAMNGDSTKPEIALAQTYFAIQTRRQEIADHEDPVKARLEMRERLTAETKGLASAATKSGVTQMGIFNDDGTRGLYGGLGLAAVKKRKGLSDKERLYDHVGTSELAAHYFKAEQTREKLIRLGVKGQSAAGKIHHDVGAEVRKAIKANGNKAPEDLPAEESIKKVARAYSKKLRNSDPASLPPSSPNA